jgi:hypothetical protein
MKRGLAGLVLIGAAVLGGATASAQRGGPGNRAPAKN